MGFTVLKENRHHNQNSSAQNPFRVILYGALPKNTAIANSPPPGIFEDADSRRSSYYTPSNSKIRIT